MWNEPARDCKHSGDITPVSHFYLSYLCIPFLPLLTALPLQKFRISKLSAKDQQLGGRQGLTRTC